LQCGFVVQRSARERWSWRHVCIVGARNAEPFPNSLGLLQRRSEGFDNLGEMTSGWAGCPYCPGFRPRPDTCACCACRGTSLIQADTLGALPRLALALLPAQGCGETIPARPQDDGSAGRNRSFLRRPLLQGSLPHEARVLRPLDQDGLWRSRNAPACAGPGWDLAGAKALRCRRCLWLVFRVGISRPWPPGWPRTKNRTDLRGWISSYGSRAPACACCGCRTGCAIPSPPPSSPSPDCQAPSLGRRPPPRLVAGVCAYGAARAPQTRQGCPESTAAPTPWG